MFSEELFIISIFQCCSKLQLFRHSCCLLQACLWCQGRLYVHIWRSVHRAPAISNTLVFLLYDVHLILFREQWVEAIPLFQFTSALDVSGNLITHCMWGHLFLYLVFSVYHG